MPTGFGGGGLDEVTRRQVEYIVTTQGQQGVDDLRRSFDDVTLKIKANVAAYQNGSRSLEEFQKDTRNLIAAQADLARQVVAAEGALANGGRVMEATGQRAQAASRAILEVGRGLEDFSTGGFLGVLNNIPTAFQAIGQAAGISAASVAMLTGGVAAIGAVAYTAYRNWDQLIGVIGIPNAETGIERMDRLAKSTKRTAEETEELNKHKREQARIQELLNRQTSEREDTKSAAELALSEAGNDQMTGGERAQKALFEMRNPTGVMARATPEERDRLATLENRLKWARRFGLDAGGKQTRIVEAARQAIEKRITDEEMDIVGKQIERGTSGDPNALRGLANALDRNPATKDIAESLRQASPEARQEAHDIDVQAEEAAREATESGKGASRAIKDARKERLRNEADIERQEGVEADEASREATQSGKQASQTLKQRRAAYDRAVDAAARTNLPALQGPDQDLTRGVNDMLGKGQTPDQIVQRFAPIANRKLGQVPGLDPALVADTAEKIIRDVIAKQAPQIVAAGGGAAGAAQLNAALAGKQFDAANRGAKADANRDSQVMAAQIAQQFQAYGANAGQAQSMTRQTLQLTAKGVDLNQAMLASWQSMQQQIMTLNARMNGIGRQIGRRPGGNWRPGRTQ